MEDDDIDDENRSKSLNRMIADFQTLISKKDMSKDNVIDIKVYNVQVATLQSLMAPHPLVLQKWVCLFDYSCTEARSNADAVACQIRKSHDDNVKNKNSSVGATKFRVRFRKGTEEELLEESTFIL